MAFTAPQPRRRRPSLTPMIDVVFLLLVFFMLAARFGMDQAIPMPLAGAGDGWQGPPRLIDVRPDGVRLNGEPTSPDALPDQLAGLTEAPSDPVILRGRDGATLQQVVDVARALTAAGYANLVLVE